MNAPTNGKPVILIVERDQHIRELQGFFLERSGYTAEFVDDGEAALARAQQHHRPSMIITEILVPVIDGLTLCRRLRDDPATADIPVVVFSILAAATRAAEAGATAFIRKPIIESVFIATVQNAIAAPSNATVEQQWAST